MHKREKARTGPTMSTEEVRRARARFRLRELPDAVLVERWQKMSAVDAEAVLYLIPDHLLTERDDVYYDGKRYRIVKPTTPIKKRGRKAEFIGEPIVLIQLKRQ